MAGLPAPSDTIVVKSPPKSMIATEIPYNIRRYHVFRAGSVLQLKISTGQFNPKFDTFIGPGSATPGNYMSPGSPDKPPPMTTRRTFSSFLNEGFLRSSYLPFPGRIYFTNPSVGSLVQAFFWVVDTMQKRLVVGSWPYSKKNHRFKYANSLVVYVDGRRIDTVTEQRLTEASYIEIVNVAPHAARVEIVNDPQTMYPIAREAQARFSPSVQVGFDYVPSEKYGFVYGPGTGGPGQQTLKRTSRAKTLERYGGAVYALPRIVLGVNAPGLSNARFVTPGRGQR